MKEKSYIMKKTMSLVMALVMCLTLCVPAFAMENFKDEATLGAAAMVEKYSLEASFRGNLVQAVAEDLNDLAVAYIDSSEVAICSVEQTGKVVYSKETTNGTIAYITVDENSDGSITVDIIEGDLHDVLNISTDGKWYLDGNEIYFGNFEVTTDGASHILTKGIWDVTYNNSPYSGYSKLSYKTYVAQSTNGNVPLTKAINSISLSLLSSIIEKAVSIATSCDFAGKVVSMIFDEVADNVKTLGTQFDPTSTSLSFKLTKNQPAQIPSLEKHYQYVGDYYAKTNYSGQRTTVYHYEDWIMN